MAPEQQPVPFPIAHRAANDLAVLRRAEAMGLPLLECDVHLYQGRLEVRHLKTAGPLPLLWDRWELADPYAPRLLLDGVLAAASPRTELMLDLKGASPRLARDVLEQVAAAGRAATSVAARSWRLLDEFDEAPGVRRFHSVGRPYQLLELRRRYGRSGVEAVTIDARLLDAAAVTGLRRLAPTVVTWPVDSLASARRLGTWGVSGIITNDLELARILLLERPERGHDLTDNAVG